MPTGAASPMAWMARDPSSCDADPLDGPVEGRHAEGHPAALEGGARGAGGGQHPLAVAEEGLGVGADVEEGAELVVFGQARGQQASRGVGADVAAHEGQAVDARLGMHGEAQLLRCDGSGSWSWRGRP